MVPPPLLLSIKQQLYHPAPPPHLAILLIFWEAQQRRQKDEFNCWICAFLLPKTANHISLKYRAIQSPHQHKTSAHINSKINTQQSACVYNGLYLQS
jgi:hypothetical protein